MTITLLYSLPHPRKTVVKSETVTHEVASSSAQLDEIKPPHVDQKIDVKALIKDIFGKDADIAIAVFTAESGLRCNAESGINKNGTRDHGIAQINDVNIAKFHGKDPLDCKANLEVAKSMFDSWGGWGAWSAYNNGSYKAFMSL